MTTDNAITESTQTFLESSGFQSYTLDTILTTNPVCPYTALSYHVSEPTLGEDLSSYGIVINQATPAALEISQLAGVTSTTLALTWWAIHDVNPVAAPITFDFTLVIVCDLTSLVVDPFVAESYSNYDYTFDVFIPGAIVIPSIIQEPAYCLHPLYQSSYTINGQSNPTYDWLTITATEYLIDPWSATHIGTYHFEITEVYGDLDYSWSVTYSFNVLIEGCLLDPPQLNELELAYRGDIVSYEFVSFYEPCLEWLTYELDKSSLGEFKANVI